MKLEKWLNKKIDISKEIDLEPFIVFCIILGIICFVVVGIFLKANNKQPIHKCINFVKYKEHYQITPLTWGYRDSFKCIECQKDYKN